MIKTILGYDVVEGVTPEAYDDWLFRVHAPDLLANPYLDRVVFSKVLRPVARTSAGAAPAGADRLPFARIGEMYFADEDAYANYVAWFDAHPVPAERGPAGRTDFRFYVVVEAVEVSRD